MVAQSPEPAQHVGHVTAEHAAQHVQFVDDDVGELAKKVGPLLVAREDPGMQHLGVGEDDVGVAPHPPSFLGCAVTVVGAGGEPLDAHGCECPQLVACQCLGGKHQQ